MSVEVSFSELIISGKIVLTMVPSMMTSEIAIEINTRPIQRFTVLAMIQRLPIKNENTPNVRLEVLRVAPTGVDPVT